MALVYYVSSAGDTNLAKNSIKALLQKFAAGSAEKEPLFIVPLTKLAQTRLADFKEEGVKTIELIDLTDDPKPLTQQQLEKILKFNSDNKIRWAHVGVPSPLKEQKALQISQFLQVPCVVVSDYATNPPSTHCFWEYLNPLVNKNSAPVTFAVPFRRAAEEVKKKNSQATVEMVGHGSLDAPFADEKFDKKSIRSLLSIKQEQQLVSILGTSQPIETDLKCLEALLTEISTGNYAALQLRMFIHPQYETNNDYMTQVLQLCAKYPKAQGQFKVVLSTDERVKKIAEDKQAWVMAATVTSTQATYSADGAVQAVQGELLVKSAVEGTPVYSHDRTPPPLDELKPRYADSPALLFSAVAKGERSARLMRKDFGLADKTAGEALSGLVPGLKLSS